MRRIVRPSVVVNRVPHKQAVPRFLPPMDRPVTPCGESKSLASARDSNLHNLSITRFSKVPELGVSALEYVIDRLTSAESAEHCEMAMGQFYEIAASLAETREFAACDLAAYHRLYPLLVPLVETAPSHVLMVLVRALRRCMDAVDASDTVKPVPKRGAVQKLVPLGPLKSPPVKGDSPTEHFMQFIAKILYKLSKDTASESYFDDGETMKYVISLANADRRDDTRTFAVGSLRNAARAESFRRRLVNAEEFGDMMGLRDFGVGDTELLVQWVGLLREIMNDSENIDVLLTISAHLRLFQVMEKFGGNVTIVFNCLRVLTRMSGTECVREDVIEHFTAEGTLILLLRVMTENWSQRDVLTRAGYVFADFAAYEHAFLDAAGRVREPLSIGNLTKLLENEGIRSDREVAAMIVQDIANLSVNKKCALALLGADVIPAMIRTCSFDESDRLGLNLMCVAANFTCHDSQWSPSSLIAMIPKAIVSKYTPLILETLRTVCNLAYCQNQKLMESRIPELLCILVRHTDLDIVLLSLQTLANLTNHGALGPRFRDGGCVQAIMEILEQDEIGASELDAGAACIMNFDSITREEADRMCICVNEFEIADSGSILASFRTFLQKRRGL